MKDDRTQHEKRLSRDLDNAKEVIEDALAHLKLPGGRKRAREVLEAGLERHGHSIRHQLNRR